MVEADGHRACPVFPELLLRNDSLTLLAVAVLLCRNGLVFLGDPGSCVSSFENPAKGPGDIVSIRCEMLGPGLG